MPTSDKHLARAGISDSKASGLVDRLLALGIDGKGRFESASAVLAKAQAVHSDPEAVVKAIVRQHLKLAVASGFVTSIGGFLVMPVALPANIAGFYLLATRMVAAIAGARGYDIEEPHVRSAVLLTLVGSEAEDVLASAGLMKPTGKITSMAVAQLPGPALMVVNKAIGFRLLASTGKSVLTRFGRAIPLVGGAVGAGLDGWILNRIADQARRDFVRQAPAIER